LDWSKAFDSIDPVCLVEALRRFGLPDKYLRIISNIYSDCEFIVFDRQQQSGQHQRCSGISQGCPLSPFLFVMLMSILLHDANELLKRDNVVLEEADCNELVYADDTLLLGSNTEHLQLYMDYIAQVGKEYGLALNWKKVEQMNINCQNMHIHDALGDHITVKQSIRYLGAQLHANGQLEAEIAQKIGLASQEFKVLKRIWNHCNISIRFKFEIFTACVLQRLLYSLETAWLNKSLRNKLDGFYAKCLHQILKINPSHISRVSNHYILQQFNAKPLSRTLLHRQL